MAGSDTLDDLMIARPGPRVTPWTYQPNATQDFYSGLLGGHGTKADVRRT